MSVEIPTLTIEDSDSFSNVIEQLIYVLDENESLFYIRTLNDVRFASKIDRLLLTAAILKQGGYISSLTASDFKKFEIDNSYGSVFYYYLNIKFTIRNHEAFNSQWCRSKSGHWTYIVR